MSQIGEQLDIVPQRLAETEAGIHDDPVLGETGSGTGTHPLCQKTGDLRNDVAILRLLLHRTRLALHVHEAHRTLQFGCRLQRTFLAERADVVDHHGAHPGRRAHDGGPARIDGNGHIGVVDDSLDYRQNPVELFLLGYVSCAGPCRLAAYIDDSGAILRHRLRLTQRSVTADESAAVRERVGCDIENPHYGRDVDMQRTERQHGLIHGRTGSSTAIAGHREGSRAEARSYERARTAINAPAPDRQSFRCPLPSSAQACRPGYGSLPYRPSPRAAWAHARP